MGERIPQERHLQRRAGVRTARVVEPVFVGRIDYVLARFVAAHGRRQRDPGQGAKRASVLAGDRDTGTAPEVRHGIDALRLLVADDLQLGSGIYRPAGLTRGLLHPLHPVTLARRVQIVRDSSQIQLGREDRHAERRERERELRPRHARKQERGGQDHRQHDRRSEGDEAPARDRARQDDCHHPMRSHRGGIDATERDHDFR